MSEFDELTPRERGWLLALWNRLRSRDNLAMGTFAEHVVAETLPGSRLRTFSMATYDIDWEGISIEVKSSVQRQEGTNEKDRPSAEKWEVRPHYGWDEDAGAWHPGDRKRWARVYVLARHEGFSHLEGWSFYVVPCWWLDGRNAVTVTGGGLRTAGWGPHSADELPDVVRERAATTPPSDEAPTA
jgi:hypothetical protein